MNSEYDQEYEEKLQVASFLAERMVGETISTVKRLLRSKSADVYFYERPKELQPSAIESAERLPIDEIEWCTIGEFSINEIISQIREYISYWHLSPVTKFVLIGKDHHETWPLHGKRYFIDGVFSKPTPGCPNPLAVAVVHFLIHVPMLLPADYPVMVTYQFEGYKTRYYAYGKRALRSLNFQRYYIDSVLHIKLAFYAEIFKCRHPPKNTDELSDGSANDERTSITSQRI